MARHISIDDQLDELTTPIPTLSDNNIFCNSTFNSTPFNYTLATPGIVAGLPEVVGVSLVVAILSIVTSGGNLMVLVSFKMDRHLQTVSNYFLLSLAVADLVIGLVSMPLYTVYLLMKRWPLGPVICDAWLSLDYTMSNASVSVCNPSDLLRSQELSCQNISLLASATELRHS